MGNPRKSQQARDTDDRPLFHASPPAGRRQRTTATAPSETASGWPLEILPRRVSRFPLPLATAFPAGAYSLRSVGTTQLQALPQANAHDPATGPSGFPDGVMRFVPSRFRRPSSPISARTGICDRKDATKPPRQRAHLEMSPPAVAEYAQSRSSSTIIRSMFVRFLAILTNASRNGSEVVCFRSCQSPFEPSSFHRTRASRAGSAASAFRSSLFRSALSRLLRSGAASVTDGDGGKRKDVTP